MNMIKEQLQLSSQIFLWHSYGWDSASRSISVTAVRVRVTCLEPAVITPVRFTIKIIFIFSTKLIENKILKRK